MHVKPLRKLSSKESKCKEGAVLEKAAVVLGMVRAPRDTGWPSRAK